MLPAGVPGTPDNSGAGGAAGRRAPAVRPTRPPFVLHDVHARLEGLCLELAGAGAAPVPWWELTTPDAVEQLCGAVERLRAVLDEQFLKCGDCHELMAADDVGAHVCGAVANAAPRAEMCVPCEGGTKATWCRVRTPCKRPRTRLDGGGAGGAGRQRRRRRRRHRRRRPHRRRRAHGRRRRRARPRRRAVGTARREARGGAAAARVERARGRGDLRARGGARADLRRSPPRCRGGRPTACATGGGGCAAAASSRRRCRATATSACDAACSSAATRAPARPPTARSRRPSARAAPRRDAAAAAAAAAGHGGRIRRRRLASGPRARARPRAERGGYLECLLLDGGELEAAALPPLKDLPKEFALKSESGDALTCGGGADDLIGDVDLHELEAILWGDQGVSV